MASMRDCAVVHGIVNKPPIYDYYSVTFFKTNKFDSLAVVDSGKADKGEL